MTVHVDDVLHVLHDLQACPHLVSLELSDIKIDFQGYSGSKRILHKSSTVESTPSPKMDCYGHTLTSGVRILQECSRFEYIDIAKARISSSEPIERDVVWPSAPFIKKLYLDLKPLGVDPRFCDIHHLALKSGVPASSTKEQQ
ncbi:hypothetical protein MVEG_09557 [Podila verticillata NRRL 6337]|nr:hypothetical protein MVEG_09557 [Podila verticillata NRRL 6337]